jgi:alkanesulfonate monooxygenase SsuD/methylene tetrahydromethanopterin reductase-like flavin-dependent oxidoreductase (luciferase family)
MTDYGHDLLFGAFITPTAHPVRQAVELALVADRSGLDLVTFQDHPYQPRFYDTWTLLSYVASLTSGVHVSGNVLNLPLRQPTVLARSAASLDLLSGGRFALGIGAGGFWDAIEAMGGRRLSPGQSVGALEEAIKVIRAIWDTSAGGGVHINGDYYQVNGAKRGPAPAHDIPIWVGAYKPKMLELTGRTADGWLPSLGYLPGGFADITEANKRIDDAAQVAGRDPAQIRRLVNVGGEFGAASRGPFNRPPEQWAEELAELALDYGMSGLILAADDAYSIELFASEVGPPARQLVADERRRRGAATLGSSGVIRG